MRVGWLVAARLETTATEPEEDGLVPARFVPLNGNDEAVLRLVTGADSDVSVVDPSDPDN